MGLVRYSLVAENVNLPLPGGGRAVTGQREGRERCAQAGVGMRGCCRRRWGPGDRWGGSRPAWCPGPCPPVWSPTTYPEPDAQDRQEVEHHHQDVYCVVDTGVHGTPVGGDAGPGEVHGWASAPG